MHEPLIAGRDHRIGLAPRCSVLTLGWRLNQDGSPACWRDDRAHGHGGYSVADLVTVPSELAAAHTAVIAQSGAGKSFLLGTLIEELLVHTKARCIVFDPNADFRNVHLLKDQGRWETARYDPETALGWLPYDTHDEFRQRWEAVTTTVYLGPEDRSVLAGSPTSDKPYYREFELWWPDIDAGILTDGLETFAQSEVQHCHRFVKAIGSLMRRYAKYNPARALSMDVVDTAEELLRSSKRSVDALRKAVRKELLPEARDGEPYIENLIQSAFNAAQYVTEPTERFYFGKARALGAAGILRNAPSFQDDRRSSLRVLDLPSFPDSGDVRRLAISALLSEIWHSARAEWSTAMEEKLKNPQAFDRRTPTFILVDEAHNLMPAGTLDSGAAALRDQFRTIVAEGRKYGLFLIVVTQRPEKVDPLILSECENKVLMRLGSEPVVKLAIQRLGLEDISRVVEHCRHYKPGRALLAGKWSETPQELFVGARRTVEGGSSLRAEHWASPHNQM